MKINFTKKQYENLLKIVYLGNWMANAIHDRSEEDPIDKDLEEIENYIFSFAKDFGLDNYVEYDEGHKKYFPTNDFDELAHKYIEEYDDDAFWEELSGRLGERDFLEKYPKEEIEKMDKEDHFLKEMDCQIYWEEEFEKNGLKKIGIRKMKS